MRPKSIVLIVIAMGCGLVASIGISQVIESRSKSSGNVATSEIFVTKVDVPIGEPLTPEMIRLEQWPKDKIPMGAITNPEELQGRRPKVPLYQGEAILSKKLISKDEVGGASEKIPKGYRVMSVKVTMDSAASGLILPGDRVDVLVYLRGGNGVPAPTTRTILTDVTVFAVNEQISRDVETDGSAIHAKTVSLLVKPDQVERLMLATELGKLRLSLRRAGDESEVTSNGASLEDLRVTEEATQTVNPDPGFVAQAPPAQDPLLGLLNSMKNQVAPSVGLNSAAFRIMEIHTPDGIQRYHWDDPTKLPRELADSGLVAAPPSAAGPSPSGADPAGVSDDDSLSD